MEKEYIIAFSSFYNAAYAQDVLGEDGIRAAMRKLPTEIVRSCGTGLYMKGGSIDDVEKVLRSKGIVPRGIYEIVYDDKKRKKFIKVNTDK